MQLPTIYTQGVFVNGLGVKQVYMSPVAAAHLTWYIICTTFINGADGSEWKEGGELCIARVEKHKFCIQALKLCN